MSAAQTGFWVPLEVFVNPACFEWLNEHGLGNAHSCFLAGEELPDGLAEDLRKCFMNKDLTTAIAELLKEYGDKPDFMLFLINAMKKPYQDLIEECIEPDAVWSKKHIKGVSLPNSDSKSRPSYQELLSFIEAILKIFPEEVLPLVRL
ncbi:MAG: hypothetical protein ACOX2O_07640 [Bdellovibrionota bacterium]